MNVVVVVIITLCLSQMRDGIQVYLMPDCSGHVTVILITFRYGLGCTSSRNVPCGQ